MSGRKAAGLLGKPLDPNTAAETRTLEDAYDAEADERGDHSYTEVPATGVTDLDGNPLAFDGPAPTPEEE